MSTLQQNPATESIAETQDEIVSEFELFGDDWDERYKYIIDLGRKLPPYPEEFRSEKFKVKGCQSQVWLHTDLNNGVMYFDVDSDASIVRGLLALLWRIYSGHSPNEVLSDPLTFIERLGMDDKLSMTRFNGLKAVIKQIARDAVVYKSITG